MTPEMSVVLAKIARLNRKAEVRDKRTLYISSRPCQVINSKWYGNFPGCRAMSMYMPRSGFADFLLYVPEGLDVYVVPRGKIAHDTSWAESALEPYKEAWHLLKETSPLMFERKVVSLSDQVQRVIAYKQPHRFLLFDRDAKFGADVLSAVRDMGSEPTRTAFRSPWQNGVAERWVGSCRRDLLDHVIVVSERHLKRPDSSRTGEGHARRSCNRNSLCR